MTPAEFRAAKEATRPWSDDRVRNELAKAMQGARDALELGVHLHVPPHAVDRTRQIALHGGWASKSTKVADSRGLTRVDLSPGPECMIDVLQFRGEQDTTVGGRVLHTAADHARFIAESKPIQPTAAAKLVDDALVASLQAVEDDVPVVRVRRHSVQLVVDAAAAQGWHCYVEHRNAFINAIPVDVRSNDEVVLGLFGEPLELVHGATLVPLAPTPPTPRRVDRPEHSFAVESCERCAEDERRSPGRGCRFSPDRANGAGDRRWEDDT